MCIYIYIYRHTHIYIYTHTYTYILTYVYIHRQIYRDSMYIDMNKWPHIWDRHTAHWATCCRLIFDP